MKNILITGATGFLGRQIVRVLDDLNVAVVPVVRPGKESSFEGIANVRRIVSSPDIFHEPVDWWEQTCDGINIVIHAAWYAEPGKYLSSSKNMECLHGSLSLARGAVRAGIKRFVGIGTCFEYDLSVGVLKVDTALKPESLYAGAKVALFSALSQWFPGQAVDFAWCRLFYLYGEGEDERRLVPYIRKQLAMGERVMLSGGTQIRDFLHVREAARRISTIALGDQQGPINICSGEPITIRRLAEKIADEFGRRDLLNFGLRSDNATDPACVIGISNYVRSERIVSK